MRTRKVNRSAAIASGTPTLRDLVNALVQKVGYSEIAKRVGIKPETLSRHMAGHFKDMNLATFLSFQRVLGVDAKTLENALEETRKNASGF